ncbi:MAG: hypothetical protein AAGF60_06400 [Pseudomonadota bacterium]
MRGLAVVMCLIAGSAQAGGMLFDCQMHDSLKRGDWVAQRLLVDLNRSGQADVTDSHTVGYTGGPVPLRVGREGDVALLNWTVDIPDDAFVNGKHPLALKTEVEYRARLNVKTGKITVRAMAPGVQDRAAGRCQAQRY